MLTELRRSPVEVQRCSLHSTLAVEVQRCPLRSEPWRLRSSGAHCDPELAKRIGEKLGARHLAKRIGDEEEKGEEKEEEEKEDEF